MQRHGWILLFHEYIVEQLQKLHTAAKRAQRNDPAGFEGDANVKLFRALSQLILETVPSDPGRDEYREGNTLGAAHRHWRRANIGRRFRLFFRYDSRSKTIVFAWVNDEQTLRSRAASRTPMLCLRRCSKKVIRQMTGSDLLPPAGLIGQDGRRDKSSARGNDYENDTLYHEC